MDIFCNVIYYVWFVVVTRYSRPFLFPQDLYRRRLGLRMRHRVRRRIRSILAAGSGSGNGSGNSGGSGNGRGNSGGSGNSSGNSGGSGSCSGNDSGNSGGSGNGHGNIGGSGNGSDSSSGGGINVEVDITVTLAGGALLLACKEQPAGEASGGGWDYGSAGASSGTDESEGNSAGWRSGGGGGSSSGNDGGGGSLWRVFGGGRGEGGGGGRGGKGEQGGAGGAGGERDVAAAAVKMPAPAETFGTTADNSDAAEEEEEEGNFAMEGREASLLLGYLCASAATAEITGAVTAAAAMRTAAAVAVAVGKEVVPDGGGSVRLSSTGGSSGAVGAPSRQGDAARGLFSGRRWGEGSKEGFAREVRRSMVSGCAGLGSKTGRRKYVRSMLCRSICTFFFCIVFLFRRCFGPVLWPWTAVGHSDDFHLKSAVSPTKQW